MLLSPISGLCAETSSSGPFWRASLRRQKSRSKLEEGGLARERRREDIVRRATAAFNAGRRDDAQKLCERGLAGQRSHD
jgi:hypothetical protein